MSDSALPEPTPSESTAQSPWPVRALAAIGRPIVAPVSSLLELVEFARLTLAYSFRLRGRLRPVAEQMHGIGNRSLLFIMVTLGFLGLVSIFQVAIQIKKVIPDFSTVGAAFIKGMIRELGPTITGLMVATRTGSGIAAEIGSMVVTEQVDALRMTNADPVDYLVAPRFMACGVMLPVLTVFGVGTAIAAGMVMGYVGFGIPFRTFLTFRLVEFSDVATGLAKAFSYGLAIPIIAAHAGLKASGGSEGVGSATTNAVVNTSFAVIVIDLIVSSVAHALGAGG